MISSHKNLKGRLKRKIFRIQKSCRKNILSGNLLNNTFTQSLSLFYFRCSNKSCSLKSCYIIRMFTCLFHKSFSSGRTGVVSKQLLQNIQKSRLSVSTSSPQNKHTLFAHVPAQRIAHCLLHKADQL